jgi:hypothetical protein
MNNNKKHLIHGMMVHMEDVIISNIIAFVLCARRKTGVGLITN